MDQVKLGKFIAERRKNKNLTQEDIADKLGITSQSVSKWERGINSPDISFLSDLGEILEVSIEELLQGEESSSKEQKKSHENKRNDILIDSIKFYEGKTKRKYKMKILCVIIISLVIISSILFAYYYNNYNKVKIYTINSIDENLEISGRLIFNPSNNIVLISDIEYNDKYTGTTKEINGKNIMVKIHTENKTIIEYGNNDLKNNGKIENLNTLLDKLFVNNVIDIQSQVKITNEDIDNLKLTIFYTKENNETGEIKVPLILDEEFSNNSIFY